MKRILLVFALVFLPSVSALAGGTDDLKNKAQAAWTARDNPASALLAVELYRKICAADPKDVASRLRLANAAYWVLEQDEGRAEIEDRDRLPKDKQIELAEIGIKSCREILARDEHNAEASYWLMWDMAARTLARGIFSGFAFKEAVVGTILISKMDAGYQYGGVYRYWGRIIYEMPGLLGKFFNFSDADSVWLYRQAIATGPNYLRNRYWLAETYLKMGRTAEAQKELQFCLNLPDQALPGEAPENRLYKQRAKVKLGKL